MTRDENEETDWLSPEVEIGEEMGADTEDRNSQTPAALGLGFT